jgi:hypothetical protein
MSDPNEFYIQQMLEGLRASMRDHGIELPAERFAAMEKEVRKRFENWSAEEFLAKCEMNKLRLFIQKLFDRQGTKTPDFDSLYQEKESLDRKLFGRDTP